MPIIEQVNQVLFDGKPAAEESIDLLLKQVEISLALIEKNWN